MPVVEQSRNEHPWRPVPLMPLTLYAAYPQNVQFKNSLAIAYAQLGVFSLEQLKDKTKAYPHV